MPELKNCGGGHVSNPSRCVETGAVVLWIKAQALHERVEDRGRAAREEIYRGAVGGIADGDLLIGKAPLTGRAPKRCPESSPNRTLLVCRPRVEGGGMDDGQRARDHRWPELRVANALQRSLVPTHDDAFG